MPLKTDEPTMAEVYGDLQIVKALVEDRMAELEFLRAQLSNIRSVSDPVRKWAMFPEIRKLLCAIDFIPEKKTDEPSSGYPELSVLE